MSQEKEIKFYKQAKDPETIAQEWLDASARAATDNDFEGHFKLISKKVRITGVPGYDSISYDDWARQSEQEFKQKLIKKVSYNGLKMTAFNDSQIMFKTMESVFANDGTKKTHGVEIVLSKEEDEVWRVIQERVMTHDECKHVGLIE